MNSIDDALHEAMIGVAVGTPARPEVVEALLLHIGVMEAVIDEYVSEEQIAEFALNHPTGIEKDTI